MNCKDCKYMNLNERREYVRNRLYECRLNSPSITTLWTSPSSSCEYLEPSDVPCVVIMPEHARQAYRRNLV